MRGVLYTCIGLFLISCTSNTIYKEPKDLIPKDSMVSLLTDMYIASSAKNQKNKFLKREKNYVVLVYEKYKIDSARFDVSNAYYTSKIDEYTEILKRVKSNIDSLDVLYREEQSIKDSLRRKIKPNKDSIFEKELLMKEIPDELIERKDRLELKKLE